MVSTHSRPKAAGLACSNGFTYAKFQHTAARRRLPMRNQIMTATKKFQHTAARRRLGLSALFLDSFLCFNTQPPEGGWKALTQYLTDEAFQHTAARRRLVNSLALSFRWCMFQHTAARRRLESTLKCKLRTAVSTHSRPKAAANFCCIGKRLSRFQHTAARRRLSLS